jgi:Tfp pilus assembly PilM family ATPase
VVARRRGNHFAISQTESLRLPAGTTDHERLIAPWIEKMGFDRIPCVLGIPGPVCMFQPFLLEPADARTFEQAASIEVVQFSEMASETMTHGFAPFSLREGERRFLLSMSRSTLIEELLRRGRELGLDVVDVAPAPAAMFRSLDLSLGGHPDPYLYLNVGHSGTDLCVGTSGGLMFARSFSSGGQMFTDALLRGRKDLTSAQAEALKVSRGSLRDGEAAGLLTPAAEMWVSEIRTCLSVYQNVFPGPSMRPTRVVIAGQGAELQGFAEYVERRLEVAAVLANDLPGRIVKDGLGAFAVAAGLAISGLGVGLPRISLLPASVRDELTFRGQKGFWVAAGIAAALILAVSLAGGFRDIRRKKEFLSEKKQSLEKRQAIADQIDYIKMGARYVRSMADPVSGLVRTGPLMRDLITVVCESVSSNDWITMVCDADSYFARDKPEAARRAAGMRDPRRARPLPVRQEVSTGRIERVMIEGYTSTPALTTIKDLIARISSQPYVKSADLLRDDELILDPDSPERKVYPEARGFVIDVALASP